MSSVTHKKRNIILFVLLLLVIVGVVVATVYTSRQQQDDPNKKSVSRMRQLDEILSGMFGTKWPYVLTFIFFLILALLGMMYTKANANNSVIKVSDKYGKIISFCLIGIFILTFIFVVINFVRLFSESEKNRTNTIDDYKPDESDNGKKIKEILLLVGLIVLAIIVVIGVISFLFKKRNPIKR